MNTTSRIERYLRALADSGSSGLTIKNYRSDLLAFEDWTNNHYSKSKLERAKLSNIIQDYAEELADANYSPATIERKLCSIKRFLEYQSIDARCVTELVQRYKAQVDKAPVWLTTKQLNKYLTELDMAAFEEDMAIVLFILNTGITAGELCRLTWGDLSFVETPGGRKRRFTIAVGEKKRAREIPLTDSATEPLLAFGLGTIAPSYKKNLKKQIFEKEGKGMTPKMVHYLVDKYAFFVDFSVSPQILRNTFCKRMADADVPLQHLAKMIGVKPEAARVYYAQPMAGPEQLLAAAEKVAI
jgi:integrase/recombinase XerC